MVIVQLCLQMYPLLFVMGWTYFTFLKKKKILSKWAVSSVKCATLMVWLFLNPWSKSEIWNPNSSCFSVCSIVVLTNWCFFLLLSIFKCFCNMQCSLGQLYWNQPGVQNMKKNIYYMNSFFVFLDHIKVNLKFKIYIFRIGYKKQKSLFLQAFKIDFLMK